MSLGPALQYRPVPSHLPGTCGLWRGLPARCIREVAFTGQFAERARNPEAPRDMSSSVTRPLTFAD
jgi:hypothetical protein